MSESYVGVFCRSILSESPFGDGSFSIHSVLVMRLAMDAKFSKCTDTPRTFCHATKSARCIRCVKNFSMCPDSPRFFRRVTKEARAIGRVEKFSTCPKSQWNGRHMTKKASAVGSAPKIPTRVSSEYPTS